MFKVVIEIDCPPGDPRPWDLVEEKIWARRGGCFFGCQEFVSVQTYETKELAEAEQTAMGEILKKLYNQGTIRYASWEIEEATS